MILSPMLPLLSSPLLSVLLCLRWLLILKPRRRLRMRCRLRGVFVLGVLPPLRILALILREATNVGLRHVRGLAGSRVRPLLRLHLGAIKELWHTRETLVWQSTRVRIISRTRRRCHGALRTHVLMPRVVKGDPATPAARCRPFTTFLVFR